MLTLDKIYHAAFVLKDVARKTDLIEAPKLSKDCQLYLKTENLQATGSFKVRGAYYKISQLSKEESEKGVIACSAGNHAQGVALAATRRGIKSIVCMPDGAPIMKVENTKNLGAEVCLVPGTYDDAHDKAVELKPFYEVLVGGKTFTALASQNLTLKELGNYPLISLSDESMTRSFYRQFFLEHDALLKPDTEAATTDQMLTLVKSELGLAFVPEPMAKDPLERGEIVQLHLQEIIPTRSICLVYDHHRPLNTAARKFQQLLTASDHKC